MPNMVCQRCFISGRVQGVFYRATATRKAKELNITGHAKNLSDGRVEILACGDKESVAAFCDWLWQGSDTAQVDDVKCEMINQPVPDTFISQLA